MIRVALMLCVVFGVVVFCVDVLYVLLWIVVVCCVLVWLLCLCCDALCVVWCGVVVFGFVLLWFGLL